MSRIEAFKRLYVRSSSAHSVPLSAELGKTLVLIFSFWVERGGKMLKPVRDTANWASRNGAFVVTVLAIAVSTLLAFYKNLDVSSVLPTILGLYLGQKASTSVSAHFASSRDDKCDTAQVIREVEGLTPPKDQ